MSSNTTHSSIKSSLVSQSLMEGRGISVFKSTSMNSNTASGVNGELVSNCYKNHLKNGGLASGARLRIQQLSKKNYRIMKNKMKITNLSVLTLIIGLIFCPTDLRGQASGGTASVSGTRKIHQFTVNGTLTKNSAIDTLPNLRLTLVGGGGGGYATKNGSGGGAGGVINITNLGRTMFTLSDVVVSVGAGGSGAQRSPAVAAVVGGNSSCALTVQNSPTTLTNSYTARGGLVPTTPTDSGGAQGYMISNSVVTRGNLGAISSAGTGSTWSGGGGGGAGAIGQIGASATTGGLGGSGLTVTNAAGVSATYGGGGSGGGSAAGGTAVDGGGAGATGAVAGGTASGIGCGGGGSDGADAGAGSSGIVIISYEGFDYFSGTAPGAWTWLTGTSHTSGAAVKIYTSTTLGASSWGTDDIYVKPGVILTINGAVVCRNLYCDGSVVISGGSLTVNNTFFASATQTLPSATYNNIYCTLATGTVTLGANTTVTGTLELTNAAAILNLNGKSLIVSKFGTGTGKLKGSSTSRMYITGSTAGTFYMDQTTDLTTNRLKYLGLAQNATATLGNRLVVYGDTSYSGVIDLRTSSVLTTNTTAADAARLVFKYNITDDRHGNIGYNGGSISGEALMEDYFPAATIRGYRQLGHTLDSAMSLNQITDDLDLYGVISSGTSGRGNNRDGLIAATSTAKNSIFLYDEKSSTGSKWVPFTTTTTNNVIPFGAGAMYVMRPAGTGEAGSYNAQLIDYEGQVTFGSKSVTCKKLASMTTNGGWNLLSNPYQTCMDFDKFLTTNNTRLNITGFKKYNKETKNYVDHVKSGSAWSRGGTSITKPNLHPGDAFWVQVTSDGDIMNFAESMLTNDPTSDVSKGNKLEMDSTLFNTLTMKLSSSQDSTIGDEITLLNASWGKSLNFSAGDMTNVNGTCIDLSVEAGNQEKISFKTLPISTDCIIPCFVAACASGTYTFNFDINYNKPVEAMKYRLLDKFTDKQLDIKAGDNYKFAIDLNDSRSFGSGRFYINCIANTLGNENINKGTSEYSIYPNPVSKTETLTIARNASSGKIGTASLLNQLGQVIYRKKITNEMGLEVLDLSSLEIQPGIYFLQLEGNNGTEAIKLVIK